MFVAGIVGLVRHEAAQVLDLLLVVPGTLLVVLLHFPHAVGVPQKLYTDKQTDLSLTIVRFKLS